jgi:transposase-like protein
MQMNGEPEKVTMDKSGANKAAIDMSWLDKSVQFEGRGSIRDGFRLLPNNATEPFKPLRPRRGLTHLKNFASSLQVD